MDLFEQLDLEWAYLARNRESLRRLAEWTTTSPGLAGLDDLEALVEHVNRRGQRSESDRVLAALACRSSTDDLAARALLQAVMPGMRCIAGRYHAVAKSAMEDSASLVISFAYERIRTYPFRQRPSRIAANVLFDTRQRLQRTVGRPGPCIVTLESLAVHPATNPRPHDESRGLLERAVAEHVITRRDAELIASTRLRDRPVSELAALLGCSAQTLRQRRLRAEARLRPLL